MIASLLLKIVLVATLLLCGFSKVKAKKGLAILQARSAANTTLKQNLSVCVSHNMFQKLPSETHFHQLVDLSDTDGCTTDDFIHSAPALFDRVVAVLRDTCNFTQKARLVQDVKGAAILVVGYISSKEFINPRGTVSKFNSFNITLATIRYYDYLRVLNLSELVEVAIYVPVTPSWDSLMIVMIVLPTVLVAAGATWSAYDEFHHIRRSLPAAESHSHTRQVQSSISTQNRESQISVWGVTVWFCFMCASILLFYFFHDYMVRFVIALFCVLGSLSLYRCLTPLWSRIVPVMYCISTDSVPYLRPKMELKDILLLISCLTVGIYWAIERHAVYAWILQDLLGAGLCVCCIHALRLPNLKVITTLLLLLLVYDVFFVFVTRFFTSDGRSIMESVVTGGRGHSRETLPLLLMLPYLPDSAWRVCLGRMYTVLGFGDVVVPGFLVAHNAIFDIRAGNRMVYFLCSSMGYLVGMVVCVISFFNMDVAQPALLYLVPSTLLPTIIVAVIRKEFRSLFFGQRGLQPTAENYIEPGPVIDNHIEPGNVDDFQYRDVNGN